MRRANKPNSDQAELATKGQPAKPWQVRVIARTLANRTESIVAAVTIMILALATAGCTSGLTGPAEGTDPSNTGDVTVPDEISELNPDEVERRLSRLLAEGSVIDDGLAAPTEVPGEPTLQEILDALNSGTPVAGSGEVVVSISPKTISGLENPLLTIKTPPMFGSATVMSPSQVLYVPGAGSENGDSFEYELFDGAESVIAVVVEVNG